MDPEAIEKFIDAHCAQIAEHFDAVQILVTDLDKDGNTTYCFRGTGNFFARVGMAKAFLDQDRAINEENAVAIDFDDDAEEED